MAFENLNEMQKTIVCDTEGSVLVLAGAGSGKTRVLTERIANILTKKLAYPSEILAITFTNKAAEEMRKRLAKMGIIDSEYIWAQTFHSFCARILRIEADKIEGYNQNFSIYDEGDKKLVLKKILKEKQIKETEILSTLMHDISSYKNANMSLEQFANLYSYRPSYDENIAIMKEYEVVMKNNNAFDFDDLLIKTLNLLKQNEIVCEKYQQYFKYISVDEFQDTNAVQYELVKILAGKSKNIFAVGDEDQSIYSWRGANVQNIQNFLKDFVNTKLYKLEQNYRSTKNIIECANKVIKNNKNRIDKTLFTENDSGVRIEYHSSKNDRQEAEYVVQQIYSLVSTCGYQYKDIAILMRLNALSRSFEDKLMTYNIPYQIFGGIKFYERMEIKNVLCYLKLLVNPKDSESFSRIINFPKRNIGDASLQKLMQKSNGNSLLSTVLSLKNEDFEDKTFAKFYNFKQIMEDFSQKKEELCVSDLCEYIIKKLDLRQVFDTDKDEDENRIRNLDELISSMKQFEEDNEDITLEEYLQNVSLISDIDTYDKDQNNLVLATVHSAKGLEFKVVFVVGLEERYFPIIRDDQDENDMEEERRLMYVAVTRCKERLYLTNAKTRYMYGSKNDTIPSRFLAEMDFKNSQANERNYGYSERTNNPYSKYGHNSYNQNSYQNYSYGEEYNNNSNTQSAKKKLYFSFEDDDSSSKKDNEQSTLIENDNAEYTVGEKVQHKSFGIGTVVSYQKDNDILTVNFDGFGNKVLSPKFAKLEKV